jgi:predicted nucleic acid-binding protein
VTSRLVVDASVAAAWVIREALTPAAMSLLQGPDTLVAPELVVSEVGNAVWKAERRAGLPLHQAQRTPQLLASAYAELHDLLPLLPHAAAAARRLNHPIYDCFYLALAQREGLPLATADRRLARLAEAEGIEVRLIGSVSGAAQP